VITTPDKHQNRIGCIVLVVKIKTKSVGTATKEPNAHTNASELGLIDRSLVINIEKLLFIQNKTSEIIFKYTLELLTMIVILQ